MKQIELTQIDAQEQALVSACKKRERFAQYAIYQRFSHPVFNTLMRMTAQREDAEDLLQETFMAVYEGIDGYKGESQLATWIQRIALNKAISLLKKRGVEDLQMDENFPEEIVDVDTFPITPSRLRREVQKLPDGARIVLVMHHFEGLQHAEIAEILNISISTSKSQLHRARKLLRNQFLGHERY